MPPPCLRIYQGYRNYYIHISLIRYGERYGKTINYPVS